MVKGLCHKDTAVLGQFCALVSTFTSHKMPKRWPNFHVHPCHPLRQTAGNR